MDNSRNLPALEITSAERPDACNRVLLRGLWMAA